MAKSKKDETETAEETTTPVEKTTPAEKTTTSAESSKPVEFPSVKFSGSTFLVNPGSVSALVELKDGTTRLWAGGAEIHTSENAATVIKKLGW